MSDLTSDAPPPVFSVAIVHCRTAYPMRRRSCACSHTTASEHCVYHEELGNQCTSKIANAQALWSALKALGIEPPTRGEEGER